MDFKQIIKNNKVQVNKIIHLITKQPNEDIEQEVYIKAWKHIDKYKSYGSFKSWISTIAKNLSKDYLKSSSYKARINSISEDCHLSSIVDTKSIPEQEMTRKFRKRRIKNAIENLKPKLKQVIILYEIEGLSYEEISSKLKVPVGTVKSRLYNAKQILAKELEDLL